MVSFVAPLFAWAGLAASFLLGLAAVIRMAGPAAGIGAPSGVIRLPRDVVFETMLAARCNQRPAGPTIRFFASGMSCGGAIALTRLGVGYEIRVNWLTGGVEVVPYDRL